MKPKRIAIRSRRVSQLLKHVEEGRFAIPRLQREFVWDGPKAAKLFDGIHAHMPIGVVMVWETGEGGWYPIVPQRLVILEHPSATVVGTRTLAVCVVICEFSAYRLDKKRSQS